MNKQGKQEKTHRNRHQYGGYQREGRCGEDEEGKRGQIDADGKGLEFGW